MNTRTTLSINETFLEILINCKERKTIAVMFLDVNGMIRAEGLIKVIYLDDPNPYLVLESGTKVMLKTIRTLNGFFSPSFS